MRTKDLEQEFLDHLSQNEGILHKICNIYASSVIDKQDLRQEIIYQLWKSYGSFRGDAGFPTWMYRVALNTALYFYKKKPPATLGLRPIEADDDDARSELEEQLGEMYRAIRSLDRIDRAIIFLYLEKHSYQQIADVTGLNIKNVSVRIVRIKEKLRKLLQNQNQS